MSRFEGKVAVVTGGSSGIGLAIAKGIAAEGGYVYITGRRQSELDRAITEIGNIGNGITAVQGDIAKLEDLDRLFATVREDRGRLDVLVANAGVVEEALIEAATPDQYDRMFDVNTRGTFFTVQKALPLMGSGGAIVLVSSVLHLMALPGHSIYNATKAAMRSFTKTWAIELKDRGIRVNTLSPGTIDTPIIDVQFPIKEHADQARVAMAAMTPLGRLGRPEELAAAALFLASDDSSFTTGADLVVDGGFQFK
ncbi:MAG: SDR family oxidoreductase [Proteobacteria bacterium]|nr:MAG: SDR family oxidoreductase [Pseudomonadota bacterium]